MPSILSGCLILLKIAMAVNDGLHSMLSSIYSIIENVLNNDHGMESVQDPDSVSTAYCSKSQILEAFNRRRANLPIFEQTEVYVSNMNPYQEITITNKDYDGKRKRSSSIVKKLKSESVENPANPHDARGSDDIRPSCPANSQSSTPSLVSSDTGNESEYQSCKTLNGSVELEENIVNIFADDVPGNTSDSLGSSTDEKTSTEADESPNTSFLNVLQRQIKFTSQALQRALSNVKNPSMRNVYGLTDSESSDSTEIASAEVRASSSPEASACRKQLMEETARLYENFLHNYYPQNKDANLRVTQNKTGLRTEECISNGNESTLEGGFVARRNFLPACHAAAASWQVNEIQQKQNCLSSITISDSSCDQTDSNRPRLGHLSDCKPVSKRLTTKRVNAYQLPLTLQKDRWIELDNFDHLKMEDSEKLGQDAELLKRNALSQSEQNDLIQTHTDDKSSDNICSEDGNDNSTDGPKVYQSSLKCNLSSHPFNLEELDYSKELDFVSLERVALLKKVLKYVGAAEVFEDSPMEEKCTVEESSNNSAPMQTSLLNVDNIPLKDLDTEEKRVAYLNDVTENYRKRMQTMHSNQKTIEEIEIDLLGDIEERHKIILDTITNGYKNQLDSITTNAGMCLNELCSIDTDLKTKFGFSNFINEAASTENCLGACVSPQTSTSVEKIHASVLPLFLTRNSKSKPLKQEENEKASVTLSKVHDLLKTENSSVTVFNLDSTLNETSTPIKNEKMDDPTWVSINLSLASQNERSMNGDKDLTSSLCYSKLRTNTLDNDHELALLDKRQELSSPDNVKEDISLEAEDWKNLAAQMSKDYENVVSLLNSIDEGENFSVKSESSENEDCKAKPGMTETEKAFVEVLNYDSAPKTQTEQIETSIEEIGTNIDDKGESNFDSLNTYNEILIRDLWNSLSDSKATVKQELEMNECLRKEHSANEKFSLTTLVTQTEIYDYLMKSYLNSSGKNANETKFQLLKLATDISENRLKFLDMKSKFSSIESKESSSDVGKSTPTFNRGGLIKQELEAAQIHDDFQVFNKVETGSNSANLSADDSNHNLGSRSEDTMLPNEGLGTVQIHDDFQVCNKVEKGSNSANLSAKDRNHNLDSRSEDTLLPNEDKAFCNEESTCTQAFENPTNC